MSRGAGDKTEQPTGKRLRDARKRGQVARSEDLASAMLLLAVVGFLWLVGGLVGGFALESLRDQFEFAAEFQGEVNTGLVFSALWRGIVVSALILIPLFMVVWVFGFFVNYLQIGSIFATEPITPGFSKLNPVEGFKKRFLSLRQYIEVVKTILKIVLTLGIALTALWSNREDIVRLMAQPFDVSAAYAFSIVIEIGFKIGIAFLVLGAIDFFLQTYLHRRDMRMSKREVREEYRETEGNPELKSKRKWLHRKLLDQGIANAVMTADVIIVDPGNRSVVLSYDRASDGAPRITACGAGLMSDQIKKLASEAGIPMMREQSLARELSKLDIGQEIPEELYEAVAAVLRWVYSESNKLESDQLQLEAVSG